MESLPLPVVLSMAIAAGFSALEILGWALLSPSYGRLLPLRRPVPADLPIPGAEDRQREHRGRGERVTWRWHPGSQALIFRRRVELGRKPYCIGRMRLDDNDRWQLSWAPFPFFAWPAVAAAWVAVLLGLGWAAIPGGLVVMSLATAMFLLVTAANLWLSKRAFERMVWPELQEQVRDWLG